MLKLQLLRLWWRCWNRVWFIVPGYWEWAWTLRCDGYRPIGEHMAQYCWRFSAHSGPCLAKITNEREPGAAWFWPDVRGPVPASNPRAACLMCQRPVHLLRPPSGEYWAHDVHPVRRPHDAVPTNWQPCARCGRFAHLLMPHSSKFCKVTGRTDKHRPHWCCPQDCENDAPVFVLPLMAEADREAIGAGLDDLTDTLAALDGEVEASGLRFVFDPRNEQVAHVHRGPLATHADREHPAHVGQTCAEYEAAERVCPWCTGLGGMHVFRDCPGASGTARATLRALEDRLDDPLPCFCAAMSNPPCTACEMGLTDPDGEESA